MSTPDLSTAENNQEPADEVSCLRATLTLMLQAMGQTDVGRVMLKMEKQLMLIEGETQAAVFSRTAKQVKQTYRQQYKVGRERAFQPIFASGTQNRKEIKLSQ